MRDLAEIRRAKLGNIPMDHRDIETIREPQALAAVDTFARTLQSVHVGRS